MTSSYHHGDLRRALIQAGVDLLRDGGVEAVGVRAAARAVGVSHAAPSRHFPDLSTFMAAVASVGYADLTTAMTADASPEDPLGAFRAAGLGYLRFALAQPNMFRLMNHPGLADKTEHPELREAAQAAFDVLVARVVDSQAGGYLRAGDPSVLALTAWSTVHGIAQLLVDDQVAVKGYKDAPLTLGEQVLGVLYTGMRPD